MAAILVAASLAIKLHGHYGVPSDEVYSSLQQARMHMQRQGWAASTQLEGMGTLQAQRGNCHMTARVLDPHGTNDAIFAEEMAPLGRIRYAWDGLWSTSLPRFAPLMSYYVKREFARQGLTASRRAVWIVALSEGCPVNVDAEFSNFSIPLGAVAFSSPAA
ncbi:MAG: hypothetical protein ABIW31_08630 [Novosphingobium sp.]